LIPLSMIPLSSAHCTDCNFIFFKGMCQLLG
jgi:hypothetical protein